MLKLIQIAVLTLTTCYPYITNLFTKYFYIF